LRILVIGGLARSLINFRGPLLRAMAELGHEVVACAPDAPPEIRARLAEIGARYQPIALARAGVNPLADLQTLMALRRLFLAERPDRVLAYTAKPVIYSCLAARWAGKPPVYTMITGLGYGFGNHSLRQKLVGAVTRALYRQALKRSAGVFFQNPDDHALFARLKLVAREVSVTLINGSGVDLNWYRPQPLPAEPVFLLIARLLVDKGLREYYDAARQLRQVHPQARFLLAGPLDPNPMSIREDELKRWQADGAIEYLGRLDDVRPAYAAARVYVLPSYREGTPRTVLEAMATGRPIITTDAPGCRETVVDGDNGFLVPVKDVAALKDAMERFILEPELARRMGEASLRLANDKYDVHKVNSIIMGAMGL
jgi:glycosyltransferase involved in cell wall biosynthesis